MRLECEGNLPDETSAEVERAGRRRRSQERCPLSCRGGFSLIPPGTRMRVKLRVFPPGIKYLGPCPSSHGRGPLRWEQHCFLASFSPVALGQPSRKSLRSCLVEAQPAGRGLWATEADGGPWGLGGLGGAPAASPACFPSSLTPISESPVLPTLLRPALPLGLPGASHLQPQTLSGKV